MSDEKFAGGLRRILGRHPYAASTLMIVLVTAIGFASDPHLHSPNLDMLYLLAVLVSALRWGLGPAVFTAFASALVFDFCFIEPRYRLAIPDAAYAISLVGFLAVALATSTLAARARQLVKEQEARARAEAASLAKDEILSKVSHELRAPLTAVVGWIQLLRDTRGDPSRMEQALSRLDRSAQGLAALVDDLLEASRLKSGKLAVHPRPLEVAPVVSEALEIASVAAERKQVRIEARINPVGLVLGDSRRLRQAVINLVGNSIKFTPAGGLVTVTLDDEDKSVRLSVMDTGAGIPREFLPRVFEPFAQADAKNPSGGLGLGLSIVKQLLEAHRGTITVASNGEGRGATFTVRLPKLSASAATQAGDVR